jgi:hypothetical protein
VRARAIAVAAITVTLAATLTGCIGDSVRDVGPWLEQQSGVTAVETVTADDLDYGTVYRAELNADASLEQIESIVDGAADRIADDEDVAVRLGIEGLDFLVTTPEQSDAALTLWRGVSGIEGRAGILSGLVTAESIDLVSLRPDAYQLLAAVFPLGVDSTVEARTTADDPQSITVGAVVGCTAPAELVQAVMAALVAPEVAFGTIDMCEGIDVTVLPDFDLATAVLSLRVQLEDAGLGAYPYRVTVQPSSGSDVHVVAISPGDPQALFVVGDLEASAIPMSYELAADRTLTIESADATAAELLAIVSASSAAASIRSVDVVGSDQTLTGAIP